MVKLNIQHHYFSVTWSFRNQYNQYNMMICSSRNIYYYYYPCWKQLCCLIL